MCRWMVLGEVVCQVEVPFLPVDSELALLHSILNPVEAHVHSLGTLYFSSAIGKSIGCGVVRGDSGWLGLFSS